ncbi:MAG: hypothetical protein KGH81_03960 [Thaumarchaeota archaeon]|nr:hypothetical protein [Nitrososphaerota archaeon]MDE1878187.1 hypothetical protein [Nitrososphaerota archaeon]
MSQREAIERIDKFIKNLDAQDTILVPEKLRAHWGIESRGWFGKKNFETFGTIGDMLSKYLAIYQQAKNTDDSLLRTQAINEALQWINRVYANGAVKPSDGIYRKYEESQDEILRLKKELQVKQDEIQGVSTDLLECETECRVLQRQLDEEKNAKRH